MGKYFGTDGFRGEANVVLTVEHAFKVGRYLGWYFGREKKARIVIGKDTRRSSYMFEYALASGLTASGADAYLLHVTTTPSVSYVVRTEDFDCGMDGSVFVILGAAGGMLIKDGMDEQANEMYERVMKSDSYYQALNIISEYVETELSVPDAETQKKRLQLLECIQKNKKKSKKQPER